jgi:predicted nucleic acid-binding protein
VYLLDVNLLIALAWDAHVFHQGAHRWFGQVGAANFATCNTTQSGFVRISLNPKAMKCSLAMTEVLAKLESFTKHPGHEFWEDGSLQVESPLMAKGVWIQPSYGYQFAFNRQSPPWQIGNIRWGH